MTVKQKRQLVRDALGNERRLVTLQAGSVTREWRAEDEGGGEDPDAPLGFNGHAAVFDSRTYIGRAPYGFYETVDRAAFDDVLEDDVRFLVNHDPNLLLARTTSGTLRLSTDKVGLVSEADMAPVSYARDLGILLDRGDISQMSFAFEVGEDHWEDVEDDDGNFVGELRTILRFKRLYDVSVVTYPAYAETDAALRAAGFDLLVAKLNLGDDQVRSLLEREKREESTDSSDTAAALRERLHRHHGLELALRG